MTHLRKMMLEELERRNYATSTIRAYLRAVDELRGISTVVPTNLDRITSASTRHICSAKGSITPTPLSSISAESASSTSGR